MRPDSASDLRVLNLVTTNASFYRTQVAALAARSVQSTTLRVPGSSGGQVGRTPVEYLQFYPAVLCQSLGDYDLVHANYGLTAPHALAQPRRPVVVTFWGTDLMGENGWVRRLSRLSARLADAVVVPSERMAAELGHPSHVVPFGVDTDLFAPEPRSEARRRLGWDDRRVVLFPYDPSRPEKDFRRAQRVVDRLPVDADLRVVTGVSHEEMPTYMNAADALLVTSRREAGPMAIKEAMACNLPVVSTDVGFARQTLCDVSPSAVCTSNRELVDALDAVLADRERSDGRKRAPEFSLDRMADRLLEVYRDVLP